MGIIGQSDQQIAGAWFRFTIFEYSVSGETLNLDSTANHTAVAKDGTSTTNSKVFHLEGGTAPTATMTIKNSTGTVPAGWPALIPYCEIAFTSGTLGRILVITMHGTTVGGVH